MKVILGIYDKTTEYFDGVSVFDNKAVAKRYLLEIKDKIPYFSDKVFYVIGKFNSETGEIVSFGNNDWQVIEIEQEA